MIHELLLWKNNFWNGSGPLIQEIAAYITNKITAHKNDEIIIPIIQKSSLRFEINFDYPCNCNISIIY